MKLYKLILLPAVAFVMEANAAVDLNVPDQDGMNIKGVVYCGDNPVVNATVSDGLVVTRTDENGRYWLKSKKERDFVMVCNPRGYRFMTKDKIYPDFYKRIATPEDLTVVEQFDFELIEDDGVPEVTFFLPDVQIADINTDLNQYEGYTVPDINNLIAEYEADGKRVIIVTLGDQSWNDFWATHSFGIPQVKKRLEYLKPAQMYNCMGNHDNDNKVAGDWAGAELFRKYWGPSYYSFNSNGIHYLVLDNIYWSNPSLNGGYSVNLDDEQLNWVKKEVQNVPSDMHIAICDHASLLTKPQCDTPNVENTIKLTKGYGTTLYESVSRFKSVKIFSGHSHVTWTSTKDKATEYNGPSVNGSLYHTGKVSKGNMIAADGSYAGYRVLENTGDDIEIYYKAIKYSRDFQFRAYDLNQCRITGEKYAPQYATPSAVDAWANTYGYGADNYNEDGTAKQPNRIMINIFNYNKNWKIDVEESGIKLDVDRKSGYDPLVMISDGCLRYPSGKNPDKTGHLFWAQANTADEPINITITDEHGRVYKQVFERPHELSIKGYLAEAAAVVTSGVDDIIYNEVEANDNDAPEEFYTITGLKVNRPGNGIYIVKKGSKVSKRYIRN